MDATGQRFAYRCIPLSIANASGWELLTPSAFAATWSGGTRKEDISFAAADPETNVSRFVMSHFGHGIITFFPGHLFRTEPGWTLTVRGSPNLPKDGIYPLDGIVETDWLPFPFTMNWMFTRPGTIRFEKGEPFCHISPLPHHLVESITPVIRDLETEPKLQAEYVAWKESRRDFNAKLRERDPDVVKAGWQRNYVRGETMTGKPATEFHRSKRLLPKPTAAGGSCPFDHDT